MRAARRLGLYKKGGSPPSYIGKSASMAAGNGAISVGVAENYASGDLLLLLLYGSNAAPGLPSGWTIVDTQNNGGYSYLRVCYKFAGASESDVAVADSGNATGGVMLAFRGVNADNPINASGKNTDTGTTFSATGITTSVANCMIVICVSFDDSASADDAANYSSWSNASLASITGIQDMLDKLTQYSVGIAAACGIMATAGATGDTTATTDSSSNYSSIITVAIAPA